MQRPATATSQNLTVFCRESLPVRRLQLPNGPLRIPVRVVRKQCGATEVTESDRPDGGDAPSTP